MRRKRDLYRSGPRSQPASCLAFNEDVDEIMFPWNRYDRPLNPNILDDNVEWFQDRASDHPYKKGYALSDGELDYNLEALNATRTGSNKL